MVGERKGNGIGETPYRRVSNLVRRQKKWLAPCHLLGHVEQEQPVGFDHAR